MKTKVTIQNGRTTIILTPENKFEETAIEDAYNEAKNYDFESCARADYNYGSMQNHRIELELKRKDG